MKKKALETLAGVACQLAFEYEGFTDEHISDMMATYEGENPGFSGSDLQDAAEIARECVDKGMTYEQAEEYVKKNFKK